MRLNEIDLGGAAAIEGYGPGFFRAGGVTQSRTEVVATHLVPARRARTAERAVAAAAALLAP